MYVTSFEQHPAHPQEGAARNMLRIVM